MNAAKEVVAQGARDRRLSEELVLKPGVRLLYHREYLTIVHVVMAERPVGAGSPIPHDHLRWAVIGTLGWGRLI